MNMAQYSGVRNIIVTITSEININKNLWAIMADQNNIPVECLSKPKFKKKKKKKKKRERKKNTNAQIPICPFLYTKFLSLMPNNNVANSHTGKVILCL